MYLLMLKKEFIQSLQVCLRSKNEILKKLSFEWIKELYCEMDTEEKFLDFNKFLIDNFKQLLLMNLEEAQNIVKLYFPNYEPFLLLQNLHDDKQLQLKYIEHLFITNSYKSYNDKFLNKHLELICRLKPDEVKNDFFLAILF